jgi:hypothetical protein
MKCRKTFLEKVTHYYTNADPKDFNKLSNITRNVANKAWGQDTCDREAIQKHLRKMIEGLPTRDKFKRALLILAELEY